MVEPGHGSPVGWTELSREVVNDLGMGMRIGEVSVREPGGTVLRRRYLHTPRVVAIVALHGESLLLIREYRAAVGAEVLQVPMGKVGGDRSPQRSALDELAEETGFRGGRCEPVGTLFGCPGWLDQVVEVYLATELTRLAARPESDDPDDIEERLSSVVSIRADDFGTLVRDGTVQDARTIAAVTLALGAPDR